MSKANLLAGSREGLLNKVLAEELAELGVSGLDALAEALFGLVLAGEHLLVEVEPFIAEILREVIGASLHEASDEVGLPVSTPGREGEREVAEEARNSESEVAGDRDVDLGNVLVPRDVRSEGLREKE